MESDQRKDSIRSEGLPFKRDIVKYFVATIFTTLLLAGCATVPKGTASVRPTGALPLSSLLAGPVFPEKGLFAWPANGRIIAPYGVKIDRVINKGIDIKVGEGSIIRAARAGRVVYCDTRQKGFGKTVIIDHGNGYQTVYAFNSEILVKTGDTVSQNDAIARSGNTGRAAEPSLHFEIRKNGMPQNPIAYLSR
jgi:murein DD-endopeptidase MepM/ murein hydrolase activator NlpD